MKMAREERFAKSTDHLLAHDAGIMAKYGSRYQRCDVAMKYT